jgi:hypothetical protein
MTKIQSGGTKYYFLLHFSIAIDRLPNFFLYFFLKVHLKISLNFRILGSLVDFKFKFEITKRADYREFSNFPIAFCNVFSKINLINNNNNLRITNAAKTFNITKRAF